jgi:2-iminobutanoate/2-iminopropanoate deaminase
VTAAPKSGIGLSWAESAQYSQTVRLGDLVFTAGQGGFGMDGRLVSGGFEEQLRQTFANLETVLTLQGASLSSVLKFTLYLTSGADYATFQQVRPEFFSAPWPASTAVIVEFPIPGLLVEIEAVAAVGEGRVAL